MNKFKAKILTNRLDYDLTSDINYAIDYNKRHGVDISFDLEKVDIKGYRSVYTQVRPDFNQYILDGAQNHLPQTPGYDITIFAFDLGEWATPPGSPYPLKPTAPSGSCVTSYNKPLINLPVYKGLANNILLVHELQHAVVYIANANGFNVPDVMDTYRENANPDSPTGNFAEQWKLLEPFISPKPLNPTVTITRSYRPSETPGELFASNAGLTMSCNTLELPWIQNKRNVSCIPTGTYQVKWVFKIGKFGWVYEIQNVPGRSGILFHSGNYAAGKKVDIEGCILLGKGFSDINGDKIPDIINSRVTRDAFNGFMGKKTFTLVIR